MDLEDQRSSSNPAALFAALLSKKSKLQDDLRNIEKQVYDMETTYLQDASQCGNVLKGYEGFLSSSKTTSLFKRSKKFQLEDRMFSLSSVTSPAAEELAGRDVGGGFGANGAGRQKKGRGGTKDHNKRMRLTSEPDLDYEDDPDVIF